MAIVYHHITDLNAIRDIQRGVLETMIQREDIESKAFVDVNLTTIGYCLYYRLVHDGFTKDGKIECIDSDVNYFKIHYAPKLGEVIKQFFQDYLQSRLES